MRIFATLLLCALSASAQAANLPTLRSEVSGASSRAEGLHRERGQMEQALGEVARRIEAIKSRDSGSSGLFRNPELDELLKQSQELSSRLSATLAAEREAEEGLSLKESRLAAELDQEIERVRRRWDEAKGREARRALVPRLKALREEREALRRAPPTTALPALPEGASDDPEELLERADALLDGEDKLRREERALQARIEQLRHERELERRMSDFLDEGSLFDETDRRIAVTRPGKAPEASVPQSDGELGGERSPYIDEPISVTGNEGSDWYGSTPPGVDVSSPGRQGGLAPVAEVEPRSGISSAPPERSGNLAAWSDGESVEELEARQQALREQADELHRKAEQTARQARDLL